MSTKARERSRKAVNPPATVSEPEVIESQTKCKNGKAKTIQKMTENGLPLNVR